MSLPSRERGLKFENENISFDDLQSLPSRERGLKSLQEVERIATEYVAPLAGAWIEISTVRTYTADSKGRSPRGSVD